MGEYNGHIQWCEGILTCTYHCMSGKANLCFSSISCLTLLDRPLYRGGGREGGACGVVSHRLIMYILANVQRTQIHTRTPCNQLCYMYRLRSHVHTPVHVRIQWYASSITVPTHAYCNVWLIDAYTYCSRGKKLCACYTTIAVCCSGVDPRINILHTPTPTCILYTYASPHSQEERDTCKGYAMYRRNSTVHVHVLATYIARAFRDLRNILQ